MKIQRIITLFCCGKIASLALFYSLESSIKRPPKKDPDCMEIDFRPREKEEEEKNWPRPKELKVITSVHSETALSRCQNLIRGTFFADFNYIFCAPWPTQANIFDDQMIKNIARWEKKQAKVDDDKNVLESFPPVKVNSYRGRVERENQVLFKFEHDQAESCRTVQARLWFWDNDRDEKTFIKSTTKLLFSWNVSVAILCVTPQKIAPTPKGRILFWGGSPQAEICGLYFGVL